MSNQIVKADGGMVAREGFGNRELERRAEMGIAAAAARAKAEIEARYIVAERRPRDWDVVRAKLLADCRRPGFARRAFYSIPRKGAKPGRLTGTPGVVEGLSVRFAEDAIRIAGNISQTTRITYEDDHKRELNVAAIDLESNSGYERDLVLYKTKERSRVREGEEVLAERINSDGNKVYLVAATEEDLLVKESALVSRIFRTEGLRLVPADILEECELEVVATVRKRDAEDPSAARKDVLDGFTFIHVPIEELKAYVGHDIGSCSPAELSQLRGLYAAIKAGEVTWAEAFEEKTGEGKVAGDGKKTVQEKLAERAAARAQSQGAATTPASAAGTFDELRVEVPKVKDGVEFRKLTGRVTDALRAKLLTPDQATKLYELLDEHKVNIDETKGG